MTKDEVVEQLKREICSRQPVSSQLDRLIALCRAPLVAEVERLRNELSTTDVLLEECKMDWSGDVTQIKAEHAHELLALQAERDDWKARALKAEQAGEVMAWGMPDALGNIVDSISPDEKVIQFPKKESGK